MKLASPAPTIVRMPSTPGRSAMYPVSRNFQAPCNLKFPITGSGPPASASKRTGPQRISTKGHSAGRVATSGPMRDYSSRSRKHGTRDARKRFQSDPRGGALYRLLVPRSGGGMVPRRFLAGSHVVHAGVAARRRRSAAVHFGRRPSSTDEQDSTWRRAASPRCSTYSLAALLCAVAIALIVRGHRAGILGSLFSRRRCSRATFSFERTPSDRAASYGPLPAFSRSRGYSPSVLRLRRSIRYSSVFRRSHRSSS